MSQYLLLRNNKESGPYSAEQLISMGLKAYDLVWENGRSAAWRYPSEVPALKAFAPSVENITSTFIKKEKPRIRVKADWRKVETVTGHQSIVNNESLKFAEPAFIQSANKEIINESFANDQYSTINNQSLNFEQQTIKQHPTSNFQLSTSNETPSWQDAWLNWEEEKKSVSSLRENSSKNFAEKNYDFIPAKNKKEETKLETKFSQSLDDIKDKYVENILRSKEKKSINPGNIFQKKYLAGAVLFALIGWGMYVGFFMKDDNPLNDMTALKPAPAVVPQTVTIPKDIASNDNNSIPLNDESSGDNNDATNNISSNKNNLPEPEQHKNIAATVKPKTVLKKSLPLISNNISNKNLTAKQNIKPQAKQIPASNKNIPVKNYASSQPAISTSQPAGHSQVVQQNNGQYTRTVARRTDNNASVNNAPQPSQTLAAPAFSHKPAKKRIEDFVTVSSSGSPYGNIQNVHLNVQNVTDVPIDLAVVDIQYFDAHNRFQKGETVYLNNIPANDNVDVKVPDSRNSAHINYKVSLVSAAQKTLYMVAD